MTASQPLSSSSTERVMVGVAFSSAGSGHRSALRNDAFTSHLFTTLTAIIKSIYWVQM